jgi:hypothetical protein
MRNLSGPELLIVMSFWVILPIAMAAAGVMVQRFRSQERLRAIEKGVPLPPAWPSRPPLSLEESTAFFRLAGIICVAVGLGLLVLFTGLAKTEPGFHRGVIGAAAIPLFLGLGFLVEYRLRSKK